ncbi:LOW QUALITY PROTEIN: probable G-protein coupled receptor 179 [Cyanistes caeruleus]|uniref:LOW QUALITY PROTEIN: probable G-protein coupled receptor 179 n=1 Tax=Cyanistes caeruleus TaxID=156563 RepID=UPI000CDA47A8|nr:LOW QUALITY PROTEIN: probable G-protein coupled receptor 179 [Cyanistes caeruleus]
MEKPPEVPKAAPERAEGSRAEVCPWESREQGRSVRAEICPWDTEGAPPEQEGQGSPKKGVEQPGMGLAGKPPAPAKPSSQRAGTTESKKANVCPWEVEDEPSPKTEICPWEQAAAPSGKERLRQDTSGTSKGEEKVGSRAPEKGKQPPAKALPKSPSGKSQSSEKAEICPWEVESSDKAEICPWEVAEPQLEKGTAPGKEKVPGKQATKALEKGSRERESICPWESPDTEQPPAKSSTRSSAVPKAAPETSQSSEKAEICPWEVESSDKAEICPWETQDSKSSDKAEICPWEVSEPPSQQPKQVPAGGSKGDKRITRQAALASPERSLDSRDRVSVCPWETQDSKSSDKAEICPWETQDSKSSDKAEICSWEVSEPQLEKGTAPRKEKVPGKQATNALEKGSRERESICPWESPDTEQPPAKSSTRSSAVPKAAPGTSQSSEKAEICPWEVESSDKAEICPWETQDSKSSDKAEICPWEVAEPQLEKGTAPGKEKVPGKQATNALEKGSRERESICPWESLDGAASDKAEICPWEVAEPQLEKGTAPGKEKIPLKEASKALEKGSRDRVSVCPWESPDTEQPPAKPRTGSSAVPKAPPGKSQSSEKAEICPWEVESSDKAEICPWEAAEPQMEKGTAPGKEKVPGKQVSKALEKGSRERESICPWETQDSKSSDKAEICPWEVAEPQLEKGTAPGKEKIPPRGASKALEKGSRDRASVCPWESPDTEELSLETAAGKEPSKKSDSTESRKSEICPWEAAEPVGSEEEISQPRGAHRDSPAGMGQAGASAVSATLVENSRGRSRGEAEHRPLCRLLPGVQHPGVGSSSSPGTGLAEVCPWEAGEAPAPARPGSDTRKSSEVCPWEEESAEPSRSCPGQGRAGGSSRDGGGV